MKRNEQTNMRIIKSKRGHLKTLAMAAWDATHGVYDGPSGTKRNKRGKVVPKGKEYRERHALWQEVVADFMKNRRREWLYKKSAGYAAYWDYLVLMDRIALAHHGLGPIVGMPVPIKDHPKLDRPKRPEPRTETSVHEDDLDDDDDEIVEVPEGLVLIRTPDGVQRLLLPEKVREWETKGWTVQDRRLVPPGTSAASKSAVKPEPQALPRVEARPSVAKPQPVDPAPWRIEFEPYWVEEEDGRDYRVDRIKTECVERIGALFLAGQVPSVLERLREHDLWPEALTTASTGSEQGNIEDALWAWAVSSAAKGWTFENGTFTRRAS